MQAEQALMQGIALQQLPCHFTEQPQIRGKRCLMHYVATRAQEHQQDCVAHEPVAAPSTRQKVCKNCDW